MNTQIVIQNIATLLQSASSRKELVSITSKFCQSKGISHFAFNASLFSNLQVTPKNYCLCNLPQRWRERYDLKGYYEKDFRVSHCKYSNSPIIWPSKNRTLTDIDRKIVFEEKDHGIKSGISFPFHGAGCEFGMFSVSTSDDFKKSILNDPNIQYEAELFGGALFDYLSKHNKKKHIKSLTDREKECLQWVSVGKTSWETSKIMGISERTVIFHIQNATTKMNTPSRTSAVVVALMNGEI